MRAFFGTALLTVCIMGAVFMAITNMNVELAKIGMENYEELNFLAEPYLASLAKMTYQHGGEEIEIYELMANAAAQGNPVFDFEGSKIDLNSVIDPIHLQFQAAFGASNYYLLIEDASGKAFFISPELNNTEAVGSMKVIAQMPLPLSNNKVSRAMVAKMGGEIVSAFSNVTEGE